MAVLKNFTPADFAAFWGGAAPAPKTTGGSGSSGSSGPASKPGSDKQPKPARTKGEQPDLVLPDNA